MATEKKTINCVVVDEEDKEVLNNQNTEETAQEENKNEENHKVEMVGSIPKSCHLEWEPHSFKAYGKTTRLSNSELALMIKGAFQKTFHDLDGVMVSCFNNNLIVSMYFKFNSNPVPNGKIKNLINLTNPDVNEHSTRSERFLAKKRAAESRGRGVLYGLTDETKLLLSDFMFGGRKANMPNSKNWHNNIQLISEMNQNPIFRGGSVTLLKVTGIDINVVLRHLYGDSMVVSTVINPDGKTVNISSDAKYQANLSKFNPDGETFMLNIEQFDINAVNKFTVMENPTYYRYGQIKYY